MSAVIILAIILIPLASIITIKDTIIWYPQLLALQFLGGICWASAFWKLSKPLAIFLGYLVFSYIYVTSANPRTLLCLMIGFAAISVTLAVSKLRNLKWIYTALMFMAIASAAYSIFQSFGIDPIFKPSGEKFNGIVGLAGSHNQLGIYSCASAFWNPMLLPISIIPIFLAKCNSAFIGLFCGALFWSYFKLTKATFKIVVVALALLTIPWWHYCHKSNAEIKERFQIWSLSLQQITSGKIDYCDLHGRKSLISTKPLFGFGLGSFFSYSPFSQYKIWGLKETHPKDDVPNYQQHFYEHAHNDTLEALYEFGYIGFLVLGCLGFSLVRVFINSSKTSGVVFTFSSLIAQSITSCFVYVMHAPLSLFMFCLTLGLFFAEVNNAKPRTLEQVAA